MDLFDLNGKVAIITGSTRGIGRAIAESYASLGARVVISSRKQPACVQVAAAINERCGRDCAVAIAASLSDKAGLQRMVDETRRHFGQIDVLVCNAASNPHFGPSATLSDEQFRKTFDNNVLANHWLVTMVAPEMMERQCGAIILISSIGGLIGSNAIGAYNMSKAAELQMMRNFAVEFGPHNVRVNAIMPGVIRTDFARALWEDPAAEAALRRATPLRRIGEPDDIAGAAVFLATKAGAFMTGQGIVVDGGYTIGFDR
jgi:NAD(P)-dependent dehydrogenase (short-subunit alcohol dehydrogenase family)